MVLFVYKGDVVLTPQRRQDILQRLYRPVNLMPYFRDQELLFTGELHLNPLYDRE